MDSDWFTTSLATAAERLLEARLVKVYKIAPPGAGNEIVAKVPGGVIWEVLGARFTFATSAAVANRIVTVTLNDADANVFMLYSSVVNHAATTSVPYQLSEGLGFSVTTTFIQTGMSSPPIPLPGGFSVRTNTALLDVGDQYTNISLIVREWSETDIVQEMVEMSQQLDSLTLPEVTGRNA